MLATKPLHLEHDIEAALQANVTALKEAFFDLLAALVLMVISVFSLLHAVLRIVFAFLGLVLWAVALLVTFLYWLRAWLISRSKNTLHQIP